MAMADGAGPRPPDPESAGAQFDELQKVCNYRFIRKSLRPAGVWSILFGLVAVVMGFGGMNVAPLKAVLGLIGIFLLLEGLWIVFDPRPGGLIADGFALIILGLWNILITFASKEHGGGGGEDGPRFFAILGFWQIIWGFQSFGRFVMVSRIPRIKPTDETIKAIDGMVKKILDAETMDAPDLIEFQVKALGGKQFWKARLAHDSAVFVRSGGDDVIFAGKDQVYMYIRDKALLGRNLNFRLAIAGRKMKGTIAPDLFDRYEAWKNSQQSGPVNQAGE